MSMGYFFPDMVYNGWHASMQTIQNNCDAQKC